jgi:hypothetical protein
MTVRFSDLVEHPDQWLLPIRGRKTKARSGRKTVSRTDPEKKHVRGRPVVDKSTAEVTA